MVMFLPCLYCRPTKVYPADIPAPSSNNENVKDSRHASPEPGPSSKPDPGESSQGHGLGQIDDEEDEQVNTKAAIKNPKNERAAGTSNEQTLEKQRTSQDQNKSSAITDSVDGNDVDSAGKHIEVVSIADTSPIRKPSEKQLTRAKKQMKSVSMLPGPLKYDDFPEVEP